MLCDPDIESVSIEDRSGGAFDDIVIQRTQNSSTYIQAKSSNYGATIIDQDWLLKATTPNGRSPLQHFYSTYLRLAEQDNTFTLEIWTNRGFDNDSKLLGALLDLKTNTVATTKLIAASNRGGIGKERRIWCEHLKITTDALAAFLDAVRWNHTGSEQDWRRQAKPLMQLAGLRSDNDAVTAGVAIVRGWVTNGSGPQTRSDAQAAIAGSDLLARSGTLLLAVHAIDRDPTPTPPNVTLDFVDLYAGDDPFDRKLLKKQDDWNTTVIPQINAAAQQLSGYRVRNVHVTGSLRHPMWFAIGRALPEVKKWVLSVDQVDATWSTTDDQETANPRLLNERTFNTGTEIAVGIGLTNDPSKEIENYITGSDIPIGRLLVYGPDSEPSPIAVPSGGWAMSWTRALREHIRLQAAEGQAGRVHLFTLCPAGVMLMLGHQWNVMPTTVLYEFHAGTYYPTATL